MVRTVDKEGTIKRRKQIVGAALDCFGKKGFHKTTMQDICKKVGLSPGTVYHYFASKDKIIEHIAQQEVEKSQEFADLLSYDVDLEQGLTHAANGILNSSEYESFQVYLEILCEAGRNKKVEKSLHAAENLALKAIKEKLKKEKKRVAGVSAESFAMFLGGQLELLEMFKMYGPSKKACAEMSVLHKKMLQYMLRDHVNVDEV